RFYILRTTKFTNRINKFEGINPCSTTWTLISTGFRVMARVTLTFNKTIWKHIVAILELKLLLITFFDQSFLRKILKPFDCFSLMIFGRSLPKEIKLNIVFRKKVLMLF